MKVLYSWLKEMVDFKFSAKELADTLTMVGLEVASVEAHNDDFVLEIEVTPNRGDCLSILGIAREIAAITGLQIKPFPPFRHQISPMPKDFKLSIELEKLCPRYTARLIRDIEVKPSPSWLKNRIEMCGIRSINNIVDVTNYIMLETGHPIHAFDYNRLSGHQIKVRQAHAGEFIVTLDKGVRELNQNILVIADSEKPVALAGIIGGEYASVSGLTKDVLIECAYFDPVTVRKAARNLGYFTESSYRFERGVDIEGLILAQNRVAQLIKQTCPCSISEIVDVYPVPFQDKEVVLRKERIGRILGTEIPQDRIIQILKGLGFQIIEEEKDFLRLKIPTHRYRDIEREIDVIEELARIYGYDKIPVSLPGREIMEFTEKKEEKVSRRVKEMLCGWGFFEVINYSFIKEEFLRLLSIYQEPDRIIYIKNPLTEEKIMRPSLIPGILNTILQNQNRGIYNLKIFEVGKVFLPKDIQTEDLPIEKEFLAAGLMGNWNERDWKSKSRFVDFYDCSAVLKGLLKELGLKATFKKEVLKFLHPGRSAAVLVEGNRIGFMGELHPEVKEKLDLKFRTYVFEIDLSKVVDLANLKKTFIPISRFPAVCRDLSIVVKEDLEVQKAEDVIRETGAELIESVVLFDIYRGEQIGKDEKSLAFSIVYRDHKTTLTDEVVDDIHGKVIKELERKLGARLRK